MATLNHTNLTTWNVLDLKTFFRTCFGFEILDERGAKFAVLRNPEGFILTLMHHKDMTPERGYPGLFHVGFLQPTEAEVDQVHEKLAAQSYQAPKPARLQRGGPPVYGFYCEAPGGVMVEVSTMNLRA
jgi:catechol-2,3-dioxygenase